MNNIKVNWTYFTNILTRQKQPPAVFYNKKLLVKISQYPQELTPVLDSLFKKVAKAGLKVCNFIKKRFQHNCFPMSIAKFCIRNSEGFNSDETWWITFTETFK